MGLNWVRKDYFHVVLRCNETSISALEMLVDDLHLDREKTVGNFLGHTGSEDFLWALVKLLSYNDVRVAGNAAYILGMLAESELGCYRILNLLKKNVVEGRSPLDDLLDMLLSDDSESVMNSAGTIGTLAETNEGRDWMIEAESVDVLLSRMALLLDNENLWTASNAALVLARLTISMLGSGRVLNHKESQTILAKLIHALGLDEAGRGMNAAFAIGRLCDLDAGRNRLLEMPESEKMISSLARMLSRADTGASKNACFALSCLATTPEGHTRLLRSCNLDDVLKTLTGLLVSVDHETSWFAAMTMRTIAGQPAGCLRLREAAKVIETLKEIIKKEEISNDLRDEILATLEILKRLSKPTPPSVTVTGGETVDVTWDPVKTKSGLLVKYQLFEGARLAFIGKELSTTVDRLEPSTQYSFRFRAFTEGDESPLSDNVLVTTDEAPPSAPTQLRVIGATTTQLKLLWEPPKKMNGLLKGYYVYCEKKLFEHTQEMTSIITGLAPATDYDVSVCAATIKGKGERTHTIGVTSELGAHAPAKPAVNVIGRNELFIAWEAPENPLGKINRYDLCMNGKVIYSGTEFNFTAHRLHPDTEYTFTVSALTNEGRCESKPTRRRTSKDEFDDTNRPPLYPARRDSDASSKAAARRASIIGKRRKSTTDVRVKTRVSSAKVSNDEMGKRPSSRKSANRRASLQLSHRPDTEDDTPPKSASKQRAESKPSISSPIIPQTPAPPRNQAAETIPETREPSPEPSSTQRSESTRCASARIRVSVKLPCVDIFNPALATRLNTKRDAVNDWLEEQNVVDRPTNETLSNDQLIESLNTSQTKSELPDSAADTHCEERPTSGEKRPKSGKGGIVKKVEFNLEENRSRKEIGGEKDLPASDPPPPELGLPRSFTTLNLTAPLTQTKTSHYADPVEVLARSRSHSIPTDFLKRANTFAGNHRPFVQRNMNRHMNGHQQWRADHAHARPLPAHLSTKFVPMQMRTQPANLPQNLKRALSNVKVHDSGEVQLRNLDSAFTRSHTQLDQLKRMSIESEIERLAIGSRRRVRDHRAEKSSEEIFNKSFTGYSRYSGSHGDTQKAPVQSAR